MILSEAKEVLKAIVKGLSPISIVVFGSAILKITLILFFSSSALAGSYLNSAHGNTTYGVKRNVTQLSGYARGNCAHCHEQHASIDGVEPEPSSGSPSEWLLFRNIYVNQFNGFCYRCHRDNSLQYNMPDQYCYTYRWGGYTSLTCPDSIKDAFKFINEDGTTNSNCGSTTGSSHQLTDIKNFIKNKWGFGSKGINPCSGCHNPHKAQRAYYPVNQKGTSPISRPSTHNTGWDIWGDDITERMNKYTYQAPYYYNSTTTYEPNGDTTYDGSNMPDYVTFCSDCHNPSYDGQISSSQKYNFTNNWQGVIYNPDWENTSPHGKVDGSKPDSMKRKPPYTANKNYVLSCTDCHEPHGSPNGMLIRKEVNGSTVDFTDWDDRNAWLSLCQRCHNIGSNHQSGNPCYQCHMHNKNWFKPI